ncbi:MAG TPA: cytochrome D1 domain-containing protein [Terriglobales bacterium]|nr:cytochrome D1 domain-containing protein [Terriglobales bacterium]
MQRSQFMIATIVGLISMLTISGAQAADSNGILLVANKAASTVGIVDPKSGEQVATIAENGITGHELISSPDGRTAYVPIYGNSGVGKSGTDGSNIVVIDIASRKIIGNIDFGHGVRPHCAAFGPEDGLLYVSTELEKSISIIDPKTLKIIGSVPTGQPESHMFAIAPDGRRAYTANVGPGTVSVLDIEKRKTIEVIPVSAQVQRISISVDGHLVFTSDQTKPQLAVIDASTNKLKTWIPLPGFGYGSASTPDGKWLAIAIPGAKQVAIIDLATMKVAHTVDVPASPQEVLVRPDGRVAYVSCDASHKIAAIRTSDWTVEKLIDAGAGTDGLAWAATK